VATSGGVFWWPKTRRGAQVHASPRHPKFEASATRRFEPLEAEVCRCVTSERLDVFHRQCRWIYRPFAFSRTDTSQSPPVDTDERAPKRRPTTRSLVAISLRPFEPACAQLAGPSPRGPSTGSRCEVRAAELGPSRFSAPPRAAHVPGSRE
jgi:hypothetical protein